MIDCEKFLDKRLNARDLCRYPGRMSSGKTIYTNGFALIESSIEYQDAKPLEEHSQQKISNVLEIFEIKHHWRKLPEIFFPEKVSCDHRSKQCLECEGHGVVEFETGYHYYEASCKSCDNYGFLKCENKDQCDNCNGTDKVFCDDDVVDVFGYKFNPKFIELIIGVPDIDVCTAKNKNDNDMLLFRFAHDGISYRGIILAKRA